MRRPAQPLPYGLRIRTSPCTSTSSTFEQFASVRRGPLHVVQRSERQGNIYIYIYIYTCMPPYVFSLDICTTFSSHAIKIPDSIPNKRILNSDPKQAKALPIVIRKNGGLFNLQVRCANIHCHNNLLRCRCGHQKAPSPPGCFPNRSAKVLVPVTPRLGWLATVTA